MVTGDGHRYLTAEKMLLRLPTDLHQELKARAAEEERSQSQILRRALRMYLDHKPT